MTTTAHAQAVEHCEWARAYGMTPNKVLLAVTGKRYPKKQTWAVAERAVEARILAGVAPRPDFERLYGVGMAPIEQWSVNTGDGTAKPRVEKTKPRRCMGCGEEFTSAGNHNRFCAGCRRKSGFSQDGSHGRGPDARKKRKAKK